jgi:hypothetical protein
LSLFEKQWNRPGRLAAAGLKPADQEEARTRIWASLSNAARRGEIEKQVVQGGKAQQVALATTRR